MVTDGAGGGVEVGGWRVGVAMRSLVFFVSGFVLFFRFFVCLFFFTLALLEVLR